MSRPGGSGNGEGRAGPSVSRTPLVLGVLVVVAAAAVMSAAAGVWPPWAEEEPREPVYPDVRETVQRLEGCLGQRGIVVLDARPRASYLKGHIPGALSLPADSITDPLASAGVFAALGLSGHERIVCAGDSTCAASAARLFWLLEVSGAQRASLLEGGVAAWREAGHPLEVAEAQAPPVTWGTDPDPDRLATTAYVVARYGESGFEVLDARGWDAWEGVIDEPLAEGHTPATAPRLGHIPHALPFDFRDLVLPDGRLMPPAESRAVLTAFGPRPATPVDVWGEFVVHDDGLSGEGAVGYFLLRRAGVADVRYYPGGWQEWASDGSLPVVRIVHAEELEQRLKAERRWFRPGAPPAGFALFDVRHRMDFERGHIPGAIDLSSGVFADSLDVVLERRWPDLDRAEAPIVTYCYGPTCIRSRDCSTAAARAGFVNVERLYGGLQEWRGMGGEVARGR